MRKKTTLFFVAACLIYVAMEGNAAEAAYYPGDDFLKKIQELLADTPFMMIGDMPLRYLQVGNTYQEGDVAQFIETPSEWKMQLEEWQWIRDGKYAGNFRVSFWMFWPDRGESWIIIHSPEGRVMNDFESSDLADGFQRRDITIDSSEAIEKSEKIQKLLKILF